VLISLQTTDGISGVFYVLNTHARNIVSCGSIRHSGRTYPPGKERYTKLDSREELLAANEQARLTHVASWLQSSAIGHSFALLFHPGLTARALEASQVPCLDGFLEAKFAVSMLTLGHFALVVLSVLL
jgi:hypothetical protein